MKKYSTLLIVTFIFSTILSSCIDENFKIDVPEGDRLVGINGYITNEYKKHEIVISRTMDFYCDEEIEKIALADEKVIIAIEGKQVRKVIVIPTRLINIIVG